MKNIKKSIKLVGMTAKEVAETCGVAWVTLRKWCKNNNIKRKLGAQGVMEYDLSDKDIEKFKARNRNKGRPKTSKKTKKPSK